MDNTIQPESKKKLTKKIRLLSYDTELLFHNGRPLAVLREYETTDYKTVFDEIFASYDTFVEHFGDCVIGPIFEMVCDSEDSHLFGVDMKIINDIYKNQDENDDTCNDDVCFQEVYKYYKNRDNYMDFFNDVYTYDSGLFGYKYVSDNEGEKLFDILATCSDNVAYTTGKIFRI